jgi:hypothetical protein
MARSSVRVRTVADERPLVAVSEAVTRGPTAWRVARPLPTWFVSGLAGIVVWIATAGALGILLLITGGYSPMVVSGVATAAAAAVALVCARRLGGRVDADHKAAVVAVAIAVGFFVFAGAFHSEHLLVDRDPAVYVVDGRTIARAHDLRPTTRVGAYTPAQFDSGYQANFFPMLPVLLALGWSVHGDVGLLLVNSLLGAIGLLACYALASRLLGARAALLALAFLALTPLQLWFARDAYSEVVVQVVALGGLWLFLEARSRLRAGVALIAGCVVGSCALARIDALTIVVGALVVVALSWVGCTADPNPARARRVVLAFGTGLVGSTVLALVLTHIIATDYINDLGAEYRELVAAFGAGLVFVAAVVLIHRARPGIGRRLVKSRTLFVLAVVAGALLVAWAYLGRPDAKGGLPVFSANKPLTPSLRNVWNNWHYSWSLHWFSAYFGVTGIVAGCVGFVVLAARARRGNLSAAAVFLVTVPVAVAYVARPSITPDLPWALRRYLPVVIPGLMIAITVALVASWNLSRTLRTAVARGTAGIAVVIALALVVGPSAAAAVPFARARAQHGALDGIHQICDVIGDDSAVFVYNAGLVYLELPGAIFSFCGVATGRSRGVDLPKLARDWHALGKRLVVATSAPAGVQKAAPGSTIIGHVVISDDDEPERVFEQPSRKSAPVPVQVWLLVVPVTAS